jgi:hypothetical protein
MPTTKLHVVTIKDGESVLPDDVQEDLSAPDTYLVTYRSSPDDDPAHAYQNEDGTWVLRSVTDGEVRWQLNRFG